jgi:indolepyruvate ferredoxin oxidoreductase beta subunit
VNIGQGVYPDLDKLQAQIQEKAAKLIAFNAATLAKESGNVLSVNMVLLGALAQTEILPFTPDTIKEAIARIKPALAELN